MKKGFTLIELLVAFAFVAISTVAVLGLVRSSLRMVKSSEEMSLAAQAVIAPGLNRKALGAQVREIRTDEIVLGPIRIESSLMEVVPEGQTEGMQIRVYR